MSRVAGGRGDADPPDTPVARLAFVLPPRSDQVTGGNLYNAELGAALARRAPALAIARIDEADWPADAAAAPATFYLADSLCLDAIDRFVAGPRRRDHRVAVIVHLLPGLDPGARDPARAATEARVLAGVSAALATSDVVGDWLATCGVARQRILIVPPALPAWARPLPAPPAPGPAPPAPGPAPLLLMVANLVPEKGVLELLDELGARLAPDDLFHLRIVGRGDLDPACARAVAAHIAAHPALAARVTLAGPCPHPALAGHYQAASLLVSAARIETYGMALAEARAMGLPIAALEVGNVAAHVDPAAGGTLCRSHAELAASVLDLVRQPAALARATAAARAAARTAAAASAARTWDAAADALLAQLTRVPGLVTGDGAV